LVQVGGFNVLTVQDIISEVGGDMTRWNLVCRKKHCFIAFPAGPGFPKKRKVIAESLVFKNC
jgi:hypothetical protein